MPIIKIKRGSGTPSGLIAGELAYDTSAQQLYVGNGSGNTKLVASAGSQSASNVNFTGGNISNSNVTATNAKFTSVTTNAEKLYYSEGSDCRPYLSNWNDQQYYNMTTCADLGNCYIHGWGGSPRSYTLSLSSIPTHSEIRYQCYVHMVDSWDNEYNAVYTTVNGGGEVNRANWRKVWTSPPNSISKASGTTANWSGQREYSYDPWNGEIDINNGYMTVDTGWYSHSDSTFSARHYTELNQAQSDEAFYVSHVKVWIRGGATNAISSIETSLSGSSTALTTDAAVRNAANAYNGSLKNMYVYTGNSTYNKSGSDVKMIRVICVGGGGGGRGYHESGGAGGYVEKFINAESISSVSVTIGGGTGGGYYFGFSSQGGTTSFGSYCSASGGGGANHNRGHCGGHGGLGYGGQVNTYGGGGGGHAPGRNNQANGMSGEGGASFFGGGTAGRHGGNSHSNEAAYGGGGSGGAGNHNGASGRSGVCIVYEYR